MTDTDRLILIDLAFKLLPIVQSDMTRTDGNAPDLLEAITESVSYAADLVAAVDSLPEEDDDPDGETQTAVEVIEPRRTRRHA